jgi:hypothetical protein
MVKFGLEKGVEATDSPIIWSSGKDGIARLPFAFFAFSA